MEAMVSAPDVEVPVCARAESRRLMTFARDYGEQVFSRGWLQVLDIFE
jgi:hypothetical protein